MVSQFNKLITLEILQMLTIVHIPHLIADNSSVPDNGINVGM